MKTKSKETVAPQKPVRYIALAGTSAKVRKSLKLLLKDTSYYCVVDSYKNLKELQLTDFAYLPDAVILEVPSAEAVSDTNKKMDMVIELLPNIKVLLYYAAALNNEITHTDLSVHSKIFATDGDEIKLARLEQALKD